MVHTAFNIATTVLLFPASNLIIKLAKKISRVKNALEIAERVLFTKSKEDILKLREYEEQVDELCAGITEYVIKITKLQISQKEHGFLARLLLAFSEVNKEKAEKVIELECNTESGIVFLDTPVGMERISDHARNIAEEVLEHVNG